MMTHIGCLGRPGARIYVGTQAAGLKPEVIG